MKPPILAKMKMATDIPLGITTPDHNLKICGGVNSMKIVAISLAIVFVALICNVNVLAQSPVAQSQPKTFADRLTYSRAVEAAIWARPLTGMKGLMDGLQRDGGVGYNDIGYFSKLQNSKFKWPTTNGTTPYVIGYWNAEKEPVVVVIPPTPPDMGVFGILADAWQRPIADVGPDGVDGGRGAKYLITTPQYRGPVPPGYILL
jgi:hypothetical protein